MPKMSFEIYENAVEDSARTFSFQNEKDIHKYLYEILCDYQDKYPITDEQIIDIVSWAELAVDGDEYALNDITIIASPD